MPKLHLARFKVDVSVPIGHPLCGGWIKPALEISEPLYAMGIVLLGDEAPVVLCSVDWTGVCNDAHIFWRERLAIAAHTTPERVAIHTVHQHNAPFVDTAAQELLEGKPGAMPIFDRDWFLNCVRKTCDAVRAGLAKTRPVTHVGTGQAQVQQVASNRRILGKSGKVEFWRGSSCRDAKLRALPEGLIDSNLKTVSFWHRQEKLAALHYYATHPMSYYGDGVVSSDFVGLARERRARDEPGITHVYFTGCAGNIAAGKYNDGGKEVRKILAGRVYEGMIGAENAVQRVPLESFNLRHHAAVLPPRSDVSERELLARVADADEATNHRNRSAMKLSYRRRAEAGIPIDFTALHLGSDIAILHLPGESFIQYQLFAQELRKRRFLATAAYGDDGPWYIPLARSYAEGGYEPTQAYVDPEAEEVMRTAIKHLV